MIVPPLELLSRFGSALSQVSGMEPTAQKPVSVPLNTRIFYNIRNKAIEQTTVQGPYTLGTESILENQSLLRTQRTETGVLQEPVEFELLYIGDFPATVLTRDLTTC